MRADREKAYVALLEARRGVGARRKDASFVKRLSELDAREDRRMLEVLWTWRDVIDVLLRGCQGTEFDGVMWEMLDQQFSRVREEYRALQQAGLMRADVSPEMLGSWWWAPISCGAPAGAGEREARLRRVGEGAPAGDGRGHGASDEETAQESTSPRSAGQAGPEAFWSRHEEQELTVKPRMLVLLVLRAARALGGESPAVKLVPAQVARASNRESVTGQLSPSKLLPLGFEVGGRLAISRVTKGEVVKAGQPLGQPRHRDHRCTGGPGRGAVMAAEASSVLASDVASRQREAEGRGQRLRRAVEADRGPAEGGRGPARPGTGWPGAGTGGATAARPAGALRRHHHRRAGQVGGMTGPGLPVYILMQLDPLVLKATIPEAVRAMVKPGLKVRVESVAGPRLDRRRGGAGWCCPRPTHRRGGCPSRSSCRTTMGASSPTRWPG